MSPLHIIQLTLWFRIDLEIIKKKKKKKKNELITFNYGT
jgi:hypothetical protein